MADAPPTVLEEEGSASCPHVLAPDLAAEDTSFLSPRRWSCERCGTTNSVWACLHCSHVGCGTCDEGHAHLHFDLSQHPIVLEINHRTLHCYSCGRDLAHDHAPQPIQSILEQLAEASSQLAHISSVVAKQQKEKDHVEDLTNTADTHRRCALLAHCFTAWVHFVAMARKTAKIQEDGDAPDDESKDLPPPPPPPLRKQLTPGITGLRNLGNTCYMNAILQALSHVPFFREYMRSLGTAHWQLDETDQGSPLSEADRRRQMFTRQTTIECFKHISRRPPKDDTESTSDSSEQGSLCNELYELIRVMWSGKWTVVTPGTLLSTLWRAVPSFHGYCQQDAQEFLCEVLDHLQAELEHLPHVPLVVNGNRRYCVIPQKLLSFLFEGSLGSQVVCDECGHVSTREEPFQDLSLDFPAQYHSSTSLRRASFRGKSLSLRICHLNDLLKHFTQVEEIPDYDCDCCHRQPNGPLPSAKKNMSVKNLPNVLRLHIKRFRWTGGSYSKITQHIKFPFELNMKSYVADGGNHDDQECVYDLSSVVVHLGSSLTSGHYISHCWNPVAESWILCNDSRMSLSSAQEVELAQAYILLYVRRHGCSGLAMGHKAPLSPSTPVPPSPLHQYSMTFQRKRSPINDVTSIPKLKCNV